MQVLLNFLFSIQVHLCFIIIILLIFIFASIHFFIIIRIAIHAILVLRVLIRHLISDLSVFVSNMLLICKWLSMVLFITFGLWHTPLLVTIIIVSILLEFVVDIQFLIVV